MAIVTQTHRRKRTAVGAYHAGEWLLHLTVLAIAGVVVLANAVG